MDRKIHRKLEKSIQVLRRHEPDIIICSEATNWLYVANGGVVCGVSADELMNVFQSYGFVDVYQKPAKPYAFVEFENVAAASNALHSLQAKHPESVAKTDVVLYFAYVKEVPVKCTQMSQKFPIGLHLVQDFVAQSEEDSLWNLIQSKLGGEEDGTELCSQQCLKKRRVLHFGYNFLYGSNGVGLDGPYPEPIPEQCDALIDRLIDCGLVKHRPDQLTVNIYEPGQGIPSHTDTHSCFQDSIISLSLLSDVVMDFCDPVNNERVAVFLPRGSLAVMTGKARYVYKHSIAARKLDVMDTGRIVRRKLRCSFTFRAVRREPCICDFPMFCDWKRQVVDGHMRIPDSEQEAIQIEKQHVTQVYNDIANHFDETRYSRWPGVTKFLETVPDVAAILDVGCGNGKYLFHKKGHFKVGCDVSHSLCEVSANKDCNILVANGLCTPFNDNSFDAAISIAVIHHFATQSELRQTEEQADAIDQRITLLEEQVKRAKAKRSELQDGVTMEGYFKEEAQRRVYQWLHNDLQSIYPACSNNNAMTNTIMTQISEGEKQTHQEKTQHRWIGLNEAHQKRMCILMGELKIEQEKTHVLQYKISVVDGKMVEAHLNKMLDK